MSKNYFNDLEILSVTLGFVVLMPLSAEVPTVPRLVAHDCPATQGLRRRPSTVAA
jgi:hypothetical protein